MPSVQKKESGATSSGLDSPAGTKVAIVTGASRGIGHGIAERLLDKGYSVVANSRNITRANTLQPGERLKLIDGDIGTHNVADGPAPARRAFAGQRHQAQWRMCDILPGGP